MSTNLVGSIEADDLQDARVLQQMAHRALRASGSTFGSSLSPNVEERVCSRPSTSGEGERAPSRSGEWR